MFGSRILEVAIGIVFVFLLVSMICSASREGIESWRKSRAAFLELGIPTRRSTRATTPWRTPDAERRLALTLKS